MLAFDEVPEMRVERGEERERRPLGFRANSDTICPKKGKSNDSGRVWMG